MTRGALLAGLARYRANVPTIERIRRQMEIFEPELTSGQGLYRAAVALVVRERRARAELLFIERATRSGDPWSGQMAFPGGRMDERDSSTRAAAERETLEEVGISLASADYLGVLGDLQGNPRFRQSDLIVTAHVYHSEGAGPVVLDQNEVREALWVPVEDLLATENHVDYASVQLREYKFPGILVGEPERHVVWGLTYRFVDMFLQAIERPLPDRWGGPGEL